MQNIVKQKNMYFVAESGEYYLWEAIVGKDWVSSLF